MNSMVKQKKIGTVTLGLSLILTGISFMFVDFTSPEDIYFLFSFWPVILIILGCEILFAGKLNPEYTFSAWSIVITLIVIGFAFFMAFAEVYISYFLRYGYL